MKVFLSVLITAFILHTSHAQQLPHYTQYILNNYILNPALSGIENYTDVKISARDQWVGLNGAPRTAYLTVHTPLGKKDYKTTATSFEVPGGNPRGNAYWENYTASAPHHGVGLSIVNDKTGNFNRFTADISYAYHLGLTPRTNIALGFSAGISQISRNLANVDFGGGETYDPAEATKSNISNLHPDLNAGLWLYNADYFIGTAIQQILPSNIYFTDTANYGGKLIPHYFLTAGYRFLLNEDINMIPSVMVKYVSNTPTQPQFDLNVKWQYRDMLWVGGSYRLHDGFAAMLGFNISNTFNVGYSYDFTQTPIHSASNGTHEVILGFLINNKYSEGCPKHVW